MASRFAHAAVPQEPIGSVTTITYKNGFLSFTFVPMNSHMSAMVEQGWEVIGQSAMPGHVRVGRTLLGATLTGGLSLFLGASRSKDSVLITYRRTRVPECRSNLGACPQCGRAFGTGRPTCQYCGFHPVDEAKAEAEQAAQQVAQKNLEKAVAERTRFDRFFDDEKKYQAMVAAGCDTPCPSCGLNYGAGRPYCQHCMFRREVPPEFPHED